MAHLGPNLAQPGSNLDQLRQYGFSGGLGSSSGLFALEEGKVKPEPGPEPVTVPVLVPVPVRLLFFAFKEEGGHGHGSGSGSGSPSSFRLEEEGRSRFWFRFQFWSQFWFAFFLFLVRRGLGHGSGSGSTSPFSLALKKAAATTTEPTLPGTVGALVQQSMPIVSSTPAAGRIPHAWKQRGQSHRIPSRTFPPQMLMRFCLATCTIWA